ncbi:PTS transporter subunit EIIB [Bacillus sp. SL00103]
MDYQKTAKELTELLGGKENVISATHCATRLRLVMKDEELIDKDAIGGT